MVFGDENDLIYPNLANCQIAVSNALIGTSSIPAPSLPSSSFLKHVEDAVSQPPLEAYKFDVERNVLARAKEWELEMERLKLIDDAEPDAAEEPRSVEVTLPESKDKSKSLCGGCIVLD